MLNVNFREPVMRLNADFSQPVIVKADDNEWTPSPMPGVERKMLDRVGEEVARATTIVRFAPNSKFSAHRHDGGEEILVLEGVFSDEHGDFPAGSYIRNPPTSSHTPHTNEGCTILVKLHQFDPDDRTHVRIDTAKGGHVREEGRPGITVLPLFDDGKERVRLENHAPGTQILIDAAGGMELLVIDGTIRIENDELGKWDWVRLPSKSNFEAVAGDKGCRVWIKTGHLDPEPDFR
jgi:hypothetical protein